MWGCALAVEHTLTSLVRVCAHACVLTHMRACVYTCVRARGFAYFPEEPLRGRARETGVGSIAPRQTACSRLPPFNPQMTYLDSFMFAWRRIKKPLHSPLLAAATRVSAGPP